MKKIPFLKRRSFYKKVALFNLFIVALTSCSYEKSNIELGSSFKETWSFSSANEYDFDASSLEIVNGQARLKPLFLDTSISGFSGGQSVGLNSSENSLELQGLDKSSTHLDIRELLPDRLNHIKAYYKMDNDNWVNSVDPSFTGTETIGDASFSLNSALGSHAGQFSGDGVDVGQPLVIGAGESYTIMGWFNPLIIDGLHRRIFDFGEVNASGRQGITCLVHDYSGSLDFRCEQWADGSGSAVGQTPIALGHMSHFALKSDGTNVTLYINGFLAGQRPHTSNQHSGHLIIGNTVTAGSPYDGLVDELVFLDVDLSENEIQKVYYAQNLQPNIFHLYGYPVGIIW